MQSSALKRITLQNFTNKFYKNTIQEIPGFVISTSNIIDTKQNLDSKHPFILEGFMLIFYKKGSGSIKVNLKQYQVKPNMVLLAPRNFILQAEDKSEDLQADFIFFDFDFIADMKLHAQLSEIPRAIQQQAVLELQPEEFQELCSIHDLILLQFKHADQYKVCIIKTLLYAIVYKLLQHYSIKITKNINQPESREQQIYTQFLSLLFKHYKTQRSINFYAEKLHLSPKYFSKMIKKIEGISALQWIEQMVIMGAKAMLKNTSLSMMEISEELSFPNPSFFGTYFKKRVGVTPLEFRNNADINCESAFGNDCEFTQNTHKLKPQKPKD
ncbi:AraC family transcriptional regulator [Myroides sp. LJL119]